jgi:hypothetical protein
MKQLYFLFITFFIISISFGQVINEFEPNPVGADLDNVSFELKGTPNTSFTGWILSIESDSGYAIGTVDRATSVSGVFDNKGLLVVSIPDLENPSFTVILVSTFTGTVGVTDIDANDDGTVDDTSSLGTVYDAIGIPDATADESSLYGVDLGGSDFKYTGDEPGLVFRDGVNGVLFAVNDPAGTDVYDINANAVPDSDFDGDPTIASYRSVNPTATTATVTKNQIAGFTMYPNPVSNGKFVITSNTGANKQVEIYSMIGKQVYSKTVKANETIDVSNLNRGIYLLRVKEEDKIATRKLIVN